MTLNDLKLRARALLRPRRVEQELEEELTFHIEREARKLIDEGMTPAEARERAQARFGSTALAADRCRDARGTGVIDNTIRDVQYALRTFASVLSYLVEQRTREIALRMALGASPRRVTQLVLGQTTWPVMAGLIAGAALAAALATAVLATPFGALITQIVHVNDPVAYLASLGLIVAVCLLAAWIPAARAAKVDPMRALRQA